MDKYEQQEEINEVFVETKPPKKLAHFGIANDTDILISVDVHYHKNKNPTVIEKSDTGGMGFPNKFGLTGNERVIGISTCFKFLVRQDEKYLVISVL